MKRTRGILVSGKRFAIVCSALPWVRGSSSFGMSSGSCCRSASISTAYWAFVLSAAFMSVLTAVPLPMFWGCLITIAPVFCASWAVLSFEPSSTTITRSTCFLAFSMTLPIFPSSLYAGMRATVFACGSSGMGGVSECVRMAVYDATAEARSACARV